LNTKTKKTKKQKHTQIKKKLFIQERSNCQTYYLYLDLVLNFDQEQ